MSYSKRLLDETPDEEYRMSEDIYRDDEWPSEQEVRDDADSECPN